MQTKKKNLAAKKISSEEKDSEIGQQTWQEVHSVLIKSSLWAGH